MLSALVLSAVVSAPPVDLVAHSIAANSVDQAIKAKTSVFVAHNKVKCSPGKCESPNCPSDCADCGCQVAKHAPKKGCDTCSDCKCSCSCPDCCCNKKAAKKPKDGLVCTPDGCHVVPRPEGSGWKWDEDGKFWYRLLPTVAPTYHAPVYAPTFVPQVPTFLPSFGPSFGGGCSGGSCGSCSSCR
jgi:hypothetical protein